MSYILPLTATGEFPFDFLHAELVNFIYEEAEKESAEESTQESSPTSSVVSKKEAPAGAEMDKVNPETKLEYMGYRVGYALVERVAKECPRFNTELDCLKFICKEFWSAVFRKQVDNLKTNHQGVYMIQDNRFFLLTSISNSHQYLELSPRHLAFSCGLIRGALANLNIKSIVTATVEQMPGVKFNVQLQPKMG